MNAMTIITLTTDLRSADGYVGAIKGVILSLAPGATLVDITHDVPPQDVRFGAHVLSTAVPYFPMGTIHLAVVDPGVGSARRGIALRTTSATFVGPDNGLFTPFLDQRVACVTLTNAATHRQPVSPTFHGRDIFAPVAAHLANGRPLADLGPEIADPLTLPIQRPRRLPNGRWLGEVTHVDRFGNLVTNLQVSEGQKVYVHIARECLAVQRTYADGAPGALLALVGSAGYVEIAVREGNAAERLGVKVGAPVEIEEL
jgi:hypothetical protein